MVGAGVGLVHAASNPPHQPLSAIGGTLIGVGIVLSLLFLGLLFLGLDVKDFFALLTAPWARNGSPRVSRAPLPEPANPSPQQAGQPATEGSAGSAPKRKITILMLGFQSSGKTLMLAALYHRLRFGNEHGVTLLPDDASERKLSELTKMIQEEDSFPEGTGWGKATLWTFAVEVRWEHARAGAFDLAYLDYAGENAARLLLKEKPDEAAEQGFLAALAEADILMGVLDGGKIRKLIAGDYDPRLAGEMQRLLRLLVLAKEKKSIHLVISKWDLLADDRRGLGLTLDDVVHRLEKLSQPFRDFRKNPQFSSLRIIPVSALGSGFVDPSPDDSTMTRIPYARWAPENADIPFYCAIPDIIKDDVERMAALAKKARGGRAKRSRLAGRQLAWVTIAALGLADIRCKLTGDLITVGIPFSGIIGYIREALEGRQRAQSPRQYDADGALAHVLSACYANMDDFEQKWGVSPPDQWGA